MVLGVEVCQLKVNSMNILAIKSKDVPSLLILLLPLFIVLFTLPLLTSHRFLLLTIQGITIILFFSFCKKIERIKLSRIDLSWAIFSLFSVLSFSWTVNVSLIWYPAFGVLSMLIWSFIFREIDIELIRKYLFPSLVMLFLIILLYVYLLLSFFNLGLDNRWNTYLGYNMNYVPTFLISLYPFVLYYSFPKKKFYSFIKLISLFLLLYIIFLSGSRGATVPLFFVLIVYLNKFNFIKDHLIVTLSLGAFLVLALYLLSSYFNINIFQEWGDIKDSSRIYNIISSLKIFLNHPVLGIGLGNWHIEAYNFDASNATMFNPTSFHRISNHNFYSQCLAELGLLGLFTYFYPFFSIVFQRYYSWTNLQPLEKACTFSILTYLITSCYYRDSNLYENHFSGIQFIAICSVGILSKDGYSQKLISKYSSLFLVFISILCLSWFTFYYKTSLDYNKAKEIPANNRKVQIDKLELIFSSTFKTTHGFYGGYTGANKSLALEIATLYREDNEFDKAELYYKRGLKLAPYDEYILLDYADFLLKEKGNIPEAKKLLLQAYAIDKNYLDTNVLLAEIALKEKEYKKVRQYLNSRSFFEWRWTNYVKMEKELYNPDYLEELVGLTKIQKEELLNNPNRGLISVLTEKQHLAYLRDRLSSKYKYKVIDNLSRSLDLTKVQRSKVLDHIIDIGVRRQDITHRLILPEIKNDPIKIKLYNIKLDSLLVAEEQGFNRILDSEQYETYKKSK